MDYERGRGRDLDRGGRDFGRGQDQDRGGRDFDRHGSRDGDRGRDSDRGRDRGRPYETDRRSRDEDRTRDDRRRDNGRDRQRSRDNPMDVSTNEQPPSQNGGDEERKSKRSRWSNDPESSSTGLDDASKKLARNTALEIAAKFSNLTQIPENTPNTEPEIPKPEPEPEEPAKPVIDITKVNTADTVNNVLGQLYDDDDDDDDDVAPTIDKIAPPPVVVETEAMPVPEAAPVSEVKTAILPKDQPDVAETNGSLENEPSKMANDIPNNTMNSDLSVPVEGEENS